MAAPTPVRGLASASRAVTAARRFLRARLGDVRAQVALLPPGKRPAQEPVHDLRVALRRLRVALRFFSAAGSGLRARLKALQDAAGAVRDRQLQLAWLASADGRASRALAPALRAGLAEAGTGLHAALAGFAALRKQLATRAARAAPRGRLGGHRLRSRLARRLDEAEARLHAARRLEPGPAHALRIALKTLRYEAELLQPAFPRELDALLALLAPVQEGLGELHDADVRAQVLEEAGLAAPAAAGRLDRERLARTLRARLAGWARARRLGTVAEALRKRRPAE